MRLVAVVSWPSSLVFCMLLLLLSDANRFIKDVYDNKRSHAVVKYILGGFYIFMGAVIGVLGTVVNFLPK